MANFTRREVYDKLHATKIVPVFYNSNIEDCKKAIKATYDGGVRAFEFVNRDDFAHEIFGELRKWSIKETPELALGIGSIIDAPTAALYLQLGADFIVSPMIELSVIEIGNQRKVAVMPGCGSLTDIQTALKAGVEIVKMFPAKEVGGPGFIKAAKAPMPWLSIMPTGGVSPDKENLTQWFSAGACCVGMGSKLFVKKDGKFDYKAIEKVTKEAIEIANSF